MTRIMSGTVSFIMMAALALSGCANDAGQSAREPAQYAQAGADTGKKERATGKKSADDVVEIKEKMFIAQTNEIYINTKDYIGKTIIYEGIFHEAGLWDNGKKYCYVIRYGPGCCPGDVSAAGFEVVWDKDYPKHNDWVKAEGVLEQYDDNGIPALRLALKSLTVLDKRGKEKVK